MRERGWTVGLLAELDPIDDRLAEKMEGGGKRLLGYNTNAGAEIHLRLRTQDLSGFLPYPSLIDTLLHELSHNEVGPHNEHFWHLFCQLKVDYLHALLRLSAKGDLFGGRSPLALADAAAEVKDVRASVLAALERDRQMPAGPLQTSMLDGYLASTAALGVGAGGGGGGAAAGGVLDGAAASSSAALSAEERRELLAAKASARLGLSATPARHPAAEPSSELSSAPAARADEPLAAADAVASATVATAMKVVSEAAKKDAPTGPGTEPETESESVPMDVSDQ